MKRAASLALAALLVALSAPPRARADDIADFEDARSAYDTGNYPVAVQRFEALVGGATPRLTSPALVLESRKYLAASLLFVDRAHDAEVQFEQLLRQDPEYEIDPVQFPTAVVDVFNRVRRRLQTELRDLRARQERERQEAQARRRADEARRRRRERELLRLATTETIVETRSRWLALVPIVGQLENGDSGAGIGFAIVEGLLLATNIASFWIHETLPAFDQVAEADRPAAAAAATAASITNRVAFGALLAFVLGGVIHAQLRFQPTIVRHRQRRLPPELRASGWGLQIAF